MMRAKEKGRVGSALFNHLAGDGAALVQRKDSTENPCKNC